MKIIGDSPRRGDLSGPRVSARRIGGAREFTTIALLAFCLAATIAITFGHRHSPVNRVKMQPTTSAHRAVAPNPSPQSNPPIASGQNQAIDDYSAWLATAAGNFGNTAQNAGNVVMQMVIDLVWDPVFGLSNRIVGYVADSWVNPVTGDRIIFNAAPGASHLAVSILAFAMVGIMMLALAGPIYASWKTWRLSRAQGFRNHSREN
jgi:hypothetical protein